MGRIEILKKIKKFLNSREIIKEDCEVVYILIELRKFLDRIKELDNAEEEKYRIVRFYADWVVHISKDRKENGIIKIMEEIDKSFKEGVIRSEQWDFIFKRKLREEMIELFEKYEIDGGKKLINNKFWFSFVDRLISILVDQPIISPIPSINKFCFNYNKDKIVTWMICFSDKRGCKEYAIRIFEE